MNKLILLIGLYVMSISLTNAQVATYKNSVRVGVDYMSLDAPDDLGFRYAARYARHFANNRIVLEGSLGYLNVQNQRLIFDRFYFDGRPRRRFTADLTASFDFLSSARHAVRLGGGPSLWYRKDDWLQSAQNTGQGSQIPGPTITSERVDELNIGYHVAAEYEYVIGARTTLGARVSMANLNRAGISSIAGVNLGYQF